MKSILKKPFWVFGLVVLWRVVMLVFTAQPIPANDAFGYDGAVVNLLRHGHYCNPSLALVFPISGREVYSTYPPLYEGAMLIWMSVWGTSVISAMALHLVLFVVAGFLTLLMVERFFPAAGNAAVVALLFFGFTFGDRPESLAFVFGLGSLWFVLRQMSTGAPELKSAFAISVLLLLTLYTSVIVGAYFFGIGFLACAFAGCRRWHLNLTVKWLSPFAVTALLFAAITAFIAKAEPLWWAGFMESAHQQPVMSTGFHAPTLVDVLKIVRTAPVFLLAAASLPWLWGCRKQSGAEPESWLCLIVGIFITGSALIAANLTLLPATYVNYVLFTQIVLAAGLLALVHAGLPSFKRWLNLMLLACVALVSIRAVGMTTWGTLCAWKNSYPATQKLVRTELKPFERSEQPVLVSSAYLYCAAALNVTNAIHADWYFDHAHWTNQAQITALIRCRPAKIVLTQFDFYRSFEPVVGQLREHPELVNVTVHDFAAVRTPDSIPSLQRVVQHISWAPVIVDLQWK